MRRRRLDRTFQVIRLRVHGLLDTMAYYKPKRFHWHLTDSPGWRIEIKK